MLCATRFQREHFVSRELPISSVLSALPGVTCLKSQNGAGVTGGRLGLRFTDGSNRVSDLVDLSEVFQKNATDFGNGLRVSMNVTV